MLLRSYNAFKDTVLTEPAKAKMLSVLQEYKTDFDRSGNNNPERYGTKGNHSIVGFSAYLLLDQLFGNGPSHNTIVTKTKNWVQEQVRHGRDEVHSPHYLERSLIPLLNLYDYSTDPQLQTWAQIGVDQLIGESALMSAWVPAPCTTRATPLQTETSTAWIFSSGNGRLAWGPFRLPRRPCLNRQPVCCS